MTYKGAYPCPSTITSLGAAFGRVFANAAKRAGKSVLVIDRRDHIAGNIYTEDVEGIQVHRYGAHIFHTSMKDVWDYVNRFAEFNNYVNSPVANFHGNMYNMPFNMNTFAKMCRASSRRQTPRPRSPSRWPPRKSASRRTSRSRRCRSSAATSSRRS